MEHYAQHYNPRKTPQTEQADPRQQKNSAGGFSFVVDDWERLRRFLVLGAEGGTYYISEPELTRDNAKAVERCLMADPASTIEAIVEMSESGRAPRNGPAIFALALAAAAADANTRKLALSVMPRVCRTSTHLFDFVRTVQQFRGWGRGLRRAIGGWYEAKGESLPYQLVKYRQRNGWTHRDVLRKAHVSTPLGDANEAALRWAVAGPESLGKREVSRGEHIEVQPSLSKHMPAIIAAYEEAKTITSPGRLAAHIVEHGLTREMVPSEMLNHVEVWEALLARMPVTSMVRNLGKMTSIGLLAPMSTGATVVAQRLADEALIQKSRVHPIALLTALKVYGRGRGMKGSLSWQPVAAVSDALDTAFYASFGNVEKAGKRIMLALDVSGSMSSPVLGLDAVSCREAAVAMAMITVQAEGNAFVAGFSTSFTPLDISMRRRLDDNVRAVSNLPFAGTDCALPMQWAYAAKAELDAFVVYTDNETWHGRVHPHQALDAYRQLTGIPAKLIVVGMASNNFTIADPSDTNMLDVVGFDMAAPTVIADFIRG